MVKKNSASAGSDKKWGQVKGNRVREYRSGWRSADQRGDGYRIQVRGPAGGSAVYLPVERVHNGLEE